MASQLSPIVDDQLGLGDHAAFFFTTNAERLAIAIPYIVKGLEDSERCVYIADENTVPAILAEFERAGVPIAQATASGALSVVTKYDSYLRHGMFEPEKMIADLDRDVELALRDGFRGLRVTGEMSWALDLPSALDQLCQYEEQLHRRWPAHLGGLCQYNESLFPSEVVQRMIGSHCIVVRGGRIIRHHAHMPPELR